MKTLAAFLVFVALSVVPARGEIILTYESTTAMRPFGVYTLEDRVTASFTFSALPSAGSDLSTLTAWDIQDGHQSLTPANSRFESWLFVNSATEGPRVAFWAFDLGDLARSIQSAFDLFPWTEVTETRRFDMARFGEGNFASNLGATRPPGIWTVSVPELVIFPKLLPRLLGLGVEAKLTYALQRTTTWLAAAILRAPHSATEIYLPALTVKVIAECAGYQTLVLMLLVAGLLALVRPKKNAILLLFFLGAAIVLALEANALRVVLIALGGEHRDGIQYATTALAIVQLVVLARLAPRVRS